MAARYNRQRPMTGPGDAIVWARSAAEVRRLLVDSHLKLIEMELQEIVFAEPYGGPGTMLIRGIV